MSSTPAGSVEAQARVQVLGELVCLGECLAWWAGEERGRVAGSGIFRPALACLAASVSPLSPTCPPSVETEKLKFTPPPRPQQCMEFDKEATVPCSATGREKPTIKWVRAGQYHVSVGRGAGGTARWSDVAMCEDPLRAQHRARNCGGCRQETEGRLALHLGRRRHKRGRIVV